MAKGNWKPEVIKPKTRCRLCGRVVKVKDFVRLGGVNPAHLSCAVAKGREYTVGTQITPNTLATDSAEVCLICSSPAIRSTGYCALHDD